nr:DNA helicase [Tanacetum cinerariifolium]
MKTKSKSVKRKFPYDPQLECEATNVAKKQYCYPTDMYGNTNTNEAARGHVNIDLQPVATPQSSKINGPTFYQTQVNSKDKDVHRHAFDPFPETNRVPTNTGCLAQCDINSDIPHVKSRSTRSGKNLCLHDFDQFPDNTNSILVYNRQSNWDEVETTRTTSHILKVPTNNDEDNRPSLRRRPKIHNFQCTYLDQQRKTKLRDRHGNIPYLHPVSTQYLPKESISVSKRILPEYNHLGQCTRVCWHCGAMFWECENVSSASHISQFGYNKCCYGGRIILRPPPEYPQYIKELYEDAHFIENIRAYNQMFSMTSLGANIDKSINNGKGRYVFRISCQLYHWIGSLCPEEGQSPRFLQLYIYDTINEVKNRLSHFTDDHQSELKKEIVEGLINFLDNHNALVQLFRTARNKHIDADVPEFKVRLYNVIGTRQYELPASETIGAIVFGDSSTTENEFDLIIKEHSQLDYIRKKQDDIRSEYLSGIYDAILRGDRDGSDIGLRTVLTASFTGSLRYMYAHYLDALLTVVDRADIVNRVFEKKVRDYIAFVCDSKTFGTVVGVLYTIEFKKHGLPHCHSLLWINGESKVQQDVDVDKYVCAELPDPVIDPHTHAIISELMIHGSYGFANPTATCMKDGGTCNRNFPKPYCNKTYIDKEGFVHYRRRDTEIQVQRQHVWLDNRYVVPYNVTLCLRYYAHINVECGWTMLIKYLFKYISKGTDRVITNVTKPLPNDPSASNTLAIQIDDLKNYVEARYIGPHEACWRILDFPIHYCNPPVQTLVAIYYIKEHYNVIKRVAHHSQIYGKSTTRTGKTFLWKTITSTLRSEEKIVLTVAASGVPDETDPKNTFAIHIPPELCIPNSDAALAVPHGNDGGETELLYHAEYLNSLNFVGFPPHRLELKVGAPIILIRNLNISGGLCNGTRLIVTQLLSKVIEARIITGTRISEKVFLPHISLINRDLQLPFIFKRKQFPIKLSYAMTINKSQSGIILPFLIWGDTAETFDMDEYNKMEKPVIIASASAWPEAHTFVPDRNTIVNTTEDKDTSHLPIVLTQTEGHTYIFQYHFGQQSKPGYPNFTLDAVLQPVTKPLLTLQAAKTIKSPTAQVLEETSVGNNTTTATEGPSKSGKLGVESPSQIPEEKAKKARRGLFQDTHTQGKKPRQDA